MIKDFESLKKQLNELAPIINSFTSESVQLKIVEIIFGEATIESNNNSNGKKPTSSAKSSRKKKNVTKQKSNTNNTTKAKRKKGQMTLINELLDENYFTKRRSVNEIANYCAVKKATTIKSKDFASALTRYIRDGKLKREKNESGQYEYYSE